MFNPISLQVDFPALERELLEKWKKDNLLEKYLHRNDLSSKKYSFLDGPITANNPMGVHHAWGRTYKDVWQRFFNMRGYKQRFQNGFDCQGLWVEVEVEKELGIRNKKDIENLVAGNKKESIAKFVELCKQRVLKYSVIQTEQSKRLGYFMDWDHSYYTMSNENNYMIWHFLKTCFDKGWIYKGQDSVPWCPRCETAISQHEMLAEDYKEITHDSIFIEYPVDNKKNTYLLAWTTTPWTLPGNVAVAIDPDKDYVEGQGKVAGKTYILVKEAAKRLNLKISKTFKGKELIGIFYQSPFDDLSRVKKALGDYKHRVVASDPLILPISVEEGTGMVHVAPGQGAEDYRLGKKEKLPMIELIDEEAVYLDEMGEFSKQNAKKHPEIIIDKLKKTDTLFDTQKYTHRYPACWRCKTELVWRVTKEWYIAMDIKERGTGKTLREQMKDTAKMIEWRPKFGLERELDWLSNMNDWLISKKNRYWGLALPIFECQKCGNFDIIGGEEELEKKVVGGWDKFKGHSPHKPYIDEVKIKCSKCGELVSRINDVGNVWLDAGIVSFSTYVDPKTQKLSYITDKKYWQEWFPADFITESFPGQFKNWFYSMIAMSTVLEKTNPFKLVLGYGSMLGEDGRPMHKSWGNMIEFNEGADKIGVDVMRWMFARQNPEQNLLFGYKKADETRRSFHLMLWNIYNFFITYVLADGWKPDKTQNKSENILDRWIISRLNNAVESSTEALEKYNIENASESIENFVNDLSLWFVRRSRDRIGPTAEDRNDKNDCYETLYFVLVTLAKLLAPFIPFVADGIYTNLTKEQSVHLADWPKANKNLIDEDLERQMGEARKLVEVVRAFRKRFNIKVRIPLKIAKYCAPNKFSDEILKVVREEINFYELLFDRKTEGYSVSAETNDSNQDLDFGLARDIVRKIQEERKNLGTQLNESVKVSAPYWPEQFENYIRKKALASSISKGEFKVTK